MNRSREIKKEILQRVKEDRNIQHTTKRRKNNWTGHMLCRNCLIKHVTEGKMEGRTEITGRRGRRSKQLLDEFQENRGYWKLKEEALCCSLETTRSGRGYRFVVRES